MITDDDIKKLKKISVSKKEFHKLTNNHQRLVLDFVKNSAKVEKRLDDIERNMVTKDDNNKILNLVDQVLGELKDMRQEQSAHNQDHVDINERLTKIETLPSIAHELKKKS